MEKADKATSASRGNPPAQSRSDKLAKALRDNLRRRKAAGRSTPPGEEPESGA